jgi:quinolinate synthase
MLAYTPEVAAATEALYKKVARVIPEVEWPFHAPYIAEINRLKREQNAVILAHNYQTPEIYHGVADIIGDSLLLAREAVTTQADTIIMAGVYFMAETAKLLNPAKKVLIPDARAGCSLADSITAADVKLMRERYPGVPVATYVNSSAEVKAESDICITSGNAVQVIESLGVPRVICLPDEYLAQYIAQNTKVEIIAWKGHCEVHERFTAKEIADYRALHPDAIVLAHPECPQDVLAVADFVGSTAKMSQYVSGKKPKRVIMITECSMSDNVAVENPDVEFVRPCNLCPHMKRITLPKILECLQGGGVEVNVPEPVASRARITVERMLAVRN